MLNIVLGLQPPPIENLPTAPVDRFASRRAEATADKSLLDKASQ